MIKLTEEQKRNFRKLYKRMERKEMWKEIKKFLYYCGMITIISLTMLIIFIGLKGEQENKNNEFVEQLTPEQYYRWQLGESFEEIKN